MQLSKQAQLRWFADWFAGRPVASYTADQFFSGPYRYVFGELAKRKPLKPTAKPAVIWKTFSALSNDLTVYHGDEGQALRERLSALIDPERAFPSLLELAATLQPITWLWENWLPIGMLSLLAARPGTGKSLVALDLCRRIIAGDAWPDGTPQMASHRACIYVDAENVPAILNRRAEEWESWGMDRRQLYPVIPDEEDGIVNLGDDRYQDLLMNMAFRLRPALIIVDSLRDILPAGESNVEDVRDTLAFLSSLATANDAAVLLVHHLRKGNSGQLALLDSIDLDQVSGSGYIGGRARVVIGLTKVQTREEPDKNGPRKIEIVKTNLGEYPPDMGILFEKMPPDDLRLTWSANAPKRYSADDAPIAPTIRDNAKTWLLAYLAEAGEPVPPKQAVEDAEEADISRATLYRVREELEGQVINTLGRKARGNCWQLADDADAAAADA